MGRRGDKPRVHRTQRREGPCGIPAAESLGPHVPGAGGLMVGGRQEGRQSPSDPPACGQEWVPPRSPQSVPVTELPQALPLPSRLTPRPRDPLGRPPWGEEAPPSLPRGLPGCLPLGAGRCMLSEPPSSPQQSPPSPHLPHLLVWGGSAGWADAVRGPRHLRPLPTRPSPPQGQDGSARSGLFHQCPEACLHWPTEGSHLHRRGN